MKCLPIIAVLLAVMPAPSPTPLRWYTAFEGPEGALVIVGFITFLAIWYQAKKTADAAEAMRKSAALQEVQLRAYVCVDSALMKFPLPGVPEAQVHFKNCGQTPAYDVRGWIHTWLGEYPLKTVLPSAPADLRRSSDTLAPGRHSIFVAPKKPPIPPQFLQILGTPQFTLYVYGEIHYRDIFGKERITKYRLMHGGEGIRSLRDKDGIEKWLLKPDAEGNETT